MRSADVFLLTLMWQASGSRAPQATDSTHYYKPFKLHAVQTVISKLRQQVGHLLGPMWLDS